jgi:hypothetical protein
MKRRIAMAAVLCLALATLLAMGVAPAASAHHSRVVHWTATEIFAEPLNIVSQKTVGDVTIIRMKNHLRDYDAKDALGNPVPMGNCELYTKGTWIVGADPTDAIMTGTYRAVCTDGSVFRGEWAGSMDMLTGAMDFVGWGHGVRGPGRGMLLYDHGVNPGGAGVPTTMTQTALRLCWSPWDH